MFHGGDLETRYTALYLPTAPDATPQRAFVDMRVDLLESEDAMRAHFNRSARNDLKRLARRAYTFDVISDPAWAPEFHDRFHSPSIASRHGEEGFVMTAAQVVRRVRNGDAEFVRAHLDGQVVGALLNERDGARYHLGRIGWLDGDAAWPALGVVTALDWHSLQHARRIGCAHVQFGGTPPILENGVFQSKTKWGAQVDADASIWGDHYLLLSPAHPHVRRLLAAHSFLVRTGDGALAVLSGRTRDDVGVPPRTASSLGRWYTLGDEASDALARELSA